MVGRGQKGFSTNFEGGWLNNCQQSRIIVAVCSEPNGVSLQRECLPEAGNGASCGESEFGNVVGQRVLRFYHHRFRVDPKSNQRCL